jgi:hypothetical protein
MRTLLQEYLDVRVSAALQQEALPHALVRTQELQDQLWSRAVTLGQEAPAIPVAAPFAQALIQMFEVNSKRVAAALHGGVPRIMRGRRRARIPRKFVYEMSGKEELITAVQAASEPQSVTEAIGTFSEAGARLYLANRSRYPLIFFIHAVTAPAALRLLLPHMTPVTQRAALAYYWQSRAAMISSSKRAKENRAPARALLIWLRCSIGRTRSMARDLDSNCWRRWTPTNVSPVTIAWPRFEHTCTR